MGSGDKRDLSKVPEEDGVTPSSGLSSCAPHTPVWVALQDGSSLILLLILGCHPLSVNLSAGTPCPTQNFGTHRQSVITAEKWESWGLPLTRWGLALSYFAPVQKEAGRGGWGGEEGVRDLAGVCRCPGSQPWGVVGGAGAVVIQEQSPGQGTLIRSRR